MNKPAESLKISSQRPCSRFWRWWFRCMVVMFTVYWLAAFVGTAIQCDAMREYYLVNPEYAPERIDFWRILRWNVTIGEQGSDGYFDNDWLLLCCLMMAGLYLGIFTGIAGLAGMFLRAFGSILRKAFRYILAGKRKLS